MATASNGPGVGELNTPKAECEALMNAALPLAKQMLQSHEEFLSYGAALGRDGEVIGIAGYDGREQPPSKDVIRLVFREWPGER